MTHNLVAHIERICEEKCMEIVNDIDATMRANAPVYTGRVLHSIRVTRIGKWKWEIGPHTDHDYWAEYGNATHGPYIEKPYAMRWVTPQGRKVATRKVRTHEGSHFVRETAKQIRARIR